MYNFNQRKNNMKISSVICYYTSMVEIFETNAIFCIAVDRFVTVVYPLRHPNIINTRVMTVLSWGIAALVAVGVYLGFKFALHMLGNSSCNLHVSENPVVHQSLQGMAFGVFSAQILIGSLTNFVVIAEAKIRTPSHTKPSDSRFLFSRCSTTVAYIHPPSTADRSKCPQLHRLPRFQGVRRCCRDKHGSLPRCRQIHCCSLSISTSWDHKYSIHDGLVVGIRSPSLHNRFLELQVRVARIHRCVFCSIRCTVFDTNSVHVCRKILLHLQTRQENFKPETKRRCCTCEILKSSPYEDNSQDVYSGVFVLRIVFTRGCLRCLFHVCFGTGVGGAVERMHLVLFVFLYQFIHQPVRLCFAIEAVEKRVSKEDMVEGFSSNCSRNKWSSFIPLSFLVKTMYSFQHRKRCVWRYTV